MGRAHWLGLSLALVMSLSALRAGPSGPGTHETINPAAQSVMRGVPFSHCVISGQVYVSRYLSLAHFRTMPNCPGAC